MNEIEDWFPEGKDYFENCATTERFSEEEIEERNRLYHGQFDDKYKEWYDIPEKDRPLNFTFLQKLFKE